MNNIFVVADLSDSKPVAIQRACELAKNTSISLHIVYFCYQSLRLIQDDPQNIKQALLDAVSHDAKKSLATLVPEGIKYSFEVVWEKRIYEWINCYAKEHNPLMVVKTAHRSETFLYTSTDWQLLRECPAPVFIVSDYKWRKSPNVLAAIDLETKRKTKQELNHQILKSAKTFTQANEAELFVCYTVPFSKVLRDLGIHYKDELEMNAKKTLKGKIEKLAAEYDIPVANFFIKAGEPEKVIPSIAAQKKAGLVVIGTVGRKGLEAKVLGNTAEKILSLLKSDVLALKPE
ncbi:universal stress protein [Colwellia sp. BRX10-3]|uniref:universal stress protein n=1 Tax=Colwellia sp. BRX10-3 TaxID=2759844 RepID=UPI0015F4D70A|nr:universal stress protein [Colwellia sp. BRX10-3]MBA6391334.1 universal stress protein [Colwellia sp. BRX10-3]